MDPLTLLQTFVRGYRRVRRVRNVSRTAHVILMAVTLLFQGLAPVTSQRMDTCDWTVWDGPEQPQGVRSITGSCSEGHVEWRHPYGAVRVILQLGTPNQTHFEACFTARTHHVVTKISLEQTTSGQATLTPLATLDESQSEMEAEVCVTSHGRPVVIYLEALVERQATNIGHVELDYDNYRIFPKVSRDDMEDCRPCTDDEILYAACTSDFVLQGSMEAVSMDRNGKDTVVQLAVDKIHRQKSKLFSLGSEQTAPAMTAPSTTPSSAKTLDNPAGRGIASLSKADSSQSEGLLFSPAKCGVRQGAGSFVFMGRIRLKRALLRCAPRLEDFEALWNRAVRTGTNICLLD